MGDAILFANEPVITDALSDCESFEPWATGILIIIIMYKSAIMSSLCQNLKCNNLFDFLCYKIACAHSKNPMYLNSNVGKTYSTREDETRLCQPIENDNRVFVFLICNIYPLLTFWPLDLQRKTCLTHTHSLSEIFTGCPKQWLFFNYSILIFIDKLYNHAVWFKPSNRKNESEPQLFYFVGNYEEGFGKERHKNKWNGPNSTMEFNANGQMTVTAKNPPAVIQKEAAPTNDNETGNSSD